MERGNAEPNSRSYRSLIKRRWLAVIAIPALAIAATLAFSWLQSPTYVAEAQIQVLSRDSDSLFNTDVIANSGETAEQLQEAIRDLEGDEVRALVGARLDPGTDPPEARASRIGATDVLAVRVQARNPDGAANVANAYVDEFIEHRREAAVAELVGETVPLNDQIDELDGWIDRLEPDDPERKRLEDQRDDLEQEISRRQIDSALKTGGASVVQSASPPARPTSRGPTRSAALIGAVAFLVALAVERAKDDSDGSMSA